MSKDICIDGQTITVADDDPRLPPVFAAPPATVTGLQVIGALTDVQAGKAKLRDLLRMAAKGAAPVSDATLVSIASAASVTPAALFAAAQGVAP